MTFGVTSRPFQKRMRWWQASSTAAPLRGELRIIGTGRDCFIRNCDWCQTLAVRHGENGPLTSFHYT